MLSTRNFCHSTDSTAAAAGFKGWQSLHLPPSAMATCCGLHATTAVLSDPAFPTGWGRCTRAPLSKMIVHDLQRSHPKRCVLVCKCKWMKVDTGFHGYPSTVIKPQNNSWLATLPRLWEFPFFPPDLEASGVQIPANNAD